MLQKQRPKSVVYVSSRLRRQVNNKVKLSARKDFQNYNFAEVQRSILQNNALALKLYELVNRKSYLASNLTFEKPLFVNSSNTNTARRVKTEETVRVHKEIDDHKRKIIRLKKLFNPRIKTETYDDLKRSQICNLNISKFSKPLSENEIINIHTFNQNVAKQSYRQRKIL